MSHSEASGRLLCATCATVFVNRRRLALAPAPPLSRRLATLTKNATRQECKAILVGLQLLGHGLVVWENSDVLFRGGAFLLGRRIQLKVERFDSWGDNSIRLWYHSVREGMLECRFTNVWVNLVQIKMGHFLQRAISPINDAPSSTILVNSVNFMFKSIQKHNKSIKNNLKKHAGAKYCPGACKMCWSSKWHH